MRRLFFLMLLLGNFPGSFAVIAAQYDAFVFDTPEQEESFKKLSNELRCLVCQNQAISDSNAGLAQDLRTEIHSMLIEGKSENEIIMFMVDRYGDYVLYRPPFKPMTWLLWFSPVVAFAVSLFFVKRFVRKQNTEDVNSELSDEEVERIRNLQSEIEALDNKHAGNEKTG